VLGWKRSAYLQVRVSDRVRNRVRDRTRDRIRDRVDLIGAGLEEICLPTGQG
jgi:hypothetical protein